jgi:hypothetical protein
MGPLNNKLPHIIIALLNIPGQLKASHLSRRMLEIHIICEMLGFGVYFYGVALL